VERLKGQADLRMDQGSERSRTRSVEDSFLCQSLIVVLTSLGRTRQEDKKPRTRKSEQLSNSEEQGTGWPGGGGGLAETMWGVQEAGTMERRSIALVGARP
jgi:hypothetical protein